MTVSEFGAFLAEPSNLPVVSIVAVFTVGAILFLCGMVIKVVKLVTRHRERMAKIAHGIDPDDRAPPDTSSERSPPS
jgi:hypothetical protein